MNLREEKSIFCSTEMLRNPLNPTVEDTARPSKEGSSNNQVVVNCKLDVLAKNKFTFKLSQKQNLCVRRFLVNTYERQKALCTRSTFFIWFMTLTEIM